MLNIIIFTILGGIFYYIFKSYSRYTDYSKKAFENFSVSMESLAKSDLGLFVALVAKVAKADGKVDALEAELIGIMFDDIAAIFPHPNKTREILKEIFEKEKNISHNTEKIAQKLASAIIRDKQKQINFMGFLIQLSFIDGTVSQSEDEILQKIASAFEFNPDTYHKIYDQFEKILRSNKPFVDKDSAYKILGVDKNDSLDTIKKTYRKLIRKYHPDIIRSQNKGEQYMQEATKKTQEINEAYEAIKKSKS